jgi:hypothetical protein
MKSHILQEEAPCNILTTYNESREVNVEKVPYPKVYTNILMDCRCIYGGG